MAAPPSRPLSPQLAAPTTAAPPVAAANETIRQTASLDRMPACLAALQFRKRLAGIPGGEVWHVQTPGGDLRRLHLLHDLHPDALTTGLVRLRQLDHPLLLGIEEAFVTENHALLWSKAGDSTLAERLEACWQQRLSGIPQQELLDYLEPVAEALDLLYRQHGLLHLYLNPSCLLHVDGQLRLAHFGFAQLLWLPSRIAPARTNEHYAAPELLSGRYSPRTDQYSLALIYAEMRTGRHPFGLPRAQRRDRLPPRPAPDLRLLSSAEREVISQALQPASDRYNGCRDLLAALTAALKPAWSPGGAQPNLPPNAAATTLPAAAKMSVLSVPPLGIPPRPLVLADSVSATFLDKIADLTTGCYQMRRGDNFIYLLNPGTGVRHICSVAATTEELLQKLEQFCRQWKAQLIYQQDHLVLLTMSGTLSPWRRWLGRSGQLLVRLQMVSAEERPDAIWAVAIAMHPRHCPPSLTRAILEDTAPQLLRHLRTALQAKIDIRSQQRWSCSQPLQVLPVYPDLTAPQTVHCVGKDISRHGIGFLAPGWLPTSFIYINLPWLPEFQDVAVKAQIVRSQPHSNGWYEIGAAFGK